MVAPLARDEAMLVGTNYNTFYLWMRLIMIGRRDHSYGAGRWTQQDKRKVFDLIFSGHLIWCSPQSSCKGLTNQHFGNFFDLSWVKLLQKTTAACMRVHLLPWWCSRSFVVVTNMKSHAQNEDANKVQRRRELQEWLHCASSPCARMLQDYGIRCICDTFEHWSEFMTWVETCTENVWHTSFACCSSVCLDKCQWTVCHATQDWTHKWLQGLWWKQWLLCAAFAPVHRRCKMRYIVWKARNLTAFCFFETWET